MNTPCHSILNLAILRRTQQPLTWPILIGSWLPDAALFVFYGWAKLANIPEATIWRDLYYTPEWQDVFAVGNSIPLALLGLGLFWWKKQPWGTTLFASMLLHHMGDLPLHHEDAHRHFWPLNNYRFISPVSYWDRRHLGVLGGLIELLLLLGASFVLIRQVRSPIGRGILVLVNVIYTFEYIQRYLVSSL